MLTKVASELQLLVIVKVDDSSKLYSDLICELETNFELQKGLRREDRRKSNFSRLTQLKQITK